MDALAEAFTGIDALVSNAALVSLGGSTPDQVAEQAAAVVALGFTGLKFDPFKGPWRTIIDRDAA